VGWCLGVSVELEDGWGERVRWVLWVTRICWLVKKIKSQGFKYKESVKYPGVRLITDGKRRIYKRW
jgi:hypothetical protein